MEAEEAWDIFRSHAVNELRKSASVAGQLDTLAAQMQNMQTGIDRLTELLPQFMGDESAIDAANDAASAPPSMPPGMGGGPEGGAAGGGEMPSEEAPEDEEEEMPEEEEDVEKSDEDADTTPVLENEENGEAPDTGADADDEEAFGPDGPAPPGDYDDGEDVDIDLEDIEEPDPEPEPQNAAYDDAGTPNDVYRQVIQMLIEAAVKANQNGRPDLMDGIAKSVGGMQMAYGQVAPVLDEIYDTDHFSKSFKSLTEGPDDPEESMEKSDVGQGETGIVPSGTPPATGGEMVKSCTGAEHPDDMIEKSTDTEMHDVEDEKGKMPEKQDGPKLGPVDMSKGTKGMHLTSIRDMMSKGCSKAEIEDELEKESLGDTLDEHIETGKELQDAGIDDKGLEQKKMEKSASPNMPDVPENGEDMSVTGTASENMPQSIDTGSEQSVTGTANKGTKPVIDPGSESSLSKCNGGDTPTQADEMNGALAKNGKAIPSIRDLMTKSASIDYHAHYTGVSRPDAVASVHGDIRTPDFGIPELMKSASEERVRMGPGVDPHKVVEKDWERYNLLKARGAF